MGPTTTLTVGVVASTAVGAAVLLLLARRSSAADRSLGLVPVVAALGVLGLGSLASFAVVRPGPYWALFALVHAAYLAAVVGVPALGVVVLGAVRARLLPRRRHLVVLGAAMAMLAPVGWYGTHVAPFRLRVERVEVELPAERAGDDPVRIGVLSDLQTNHVGAHERRTVDRLLAERPDLILVTGDVFQGDDAQFAAARDDLRSLLRRLEAPGGVFAVRGDVDQGDQLDLLLEGSAVRILDDEVVHLELGDRRIALLGNRLHWDDPPGPAARDELRRAPPDEVRIAFAHRPDVAFGFPTPGEVDLVVAGHTHGGQVSLPVFGPPVTFSEVPRRVGAGGLHAVNGNPIYVSVGTGVERIQAPQVRLGTRPTIGVVTIR